MRSGSNSKDLCVFWASPLPPFTVYENVPGSFGPLGEGSGFSLRSPDVNLFAWERVDLSRHVDKN